MRRYHIYIEAGIDKSSKVLQKQYPELTAQEARDIAGGGMFIASMVKDGSGIATQILRHTAKVKVDLQKGIDKHIDATHKPISPIFEDQTNDKLNYHSNFDVDKIDFSSTPRIELGRLTPEARQKVFNKLSNDVPIGRVDYTKGFVYDMSNFIEGTERLFNGKLKEDLYLINYHDKNIPLSTGLKDRTMKYATHLEIGNKMPTIHDIHQHLALKHEWGKRNSYSIIKVPKGEQVTFIHGKAASQISDKAGDRFVGGGYQVRFKDFDEKWIIKTEDLKK